MFGWRRRESSILSLIYANAFSYFLSLSYSISQSTLVLNEAEQCPHSALTTKVQRFDFIYLPRQSTRTNYRIPSFVTLK
jgi:hypothetical protein